MQNFIDFLIQVYDSKDVVLYTAKDVDQNFLFSNQNRLNDNYELYIQEEDKDKKKIYIYSNINNYGLYAMDNRLTDSEMWDEQEDF